jgi:tetratricopeptide (TPR) repeat protein
MGEATRQKSWLRQFVDFALDRDVEAEIEQQNSLIERSPDPAKVHLDLAVLHYSRRDVARAIAHCEAAIECNPSYARAYSKLGEIHVSAGRYDRAHDYALKAAELGDRSLLDLFERYPDATASVRKAGGPD